MKLTSPHFLASIALSTLLAAPAWAWDNGLAKTPPMGWNTWNKYHCDITDDLVRRNAAAMVASGLKDAGYQYVVIDDCWASSRADDGSIQPDTTRFPDMKGLADYVHGLGLKLGIYTDAGVATCGLKPGSYGHEAQDIATYATWGIDYVKVDWCNTNHNTGLHPPTDLQAHISFPVFRDAIIAAKRPMVLSACTGPVLNDPATVPADPPFGIDNPWAWGPGAANLWRTSYDISDTWSSMLGNFQKNSAHPTVAGPGAWNDPDVLEVGNGGMTTVEYTTHFSLWAMEAAPLMAGNDLTSMSADTLAILSNKEVIAVNQDPLGAQATQVIQSGSTSVWRKPLAGGAVAVLLLNEGASTATISTNAQLLGLTSGFPLAVRDLWKHAAASPLTDASTALSSDVPSHGVTMLVVGNTTTGAPGTPTTGSTTGSDSAPPDTTSPGSTSLQPASASSHGVGCAATPGLAPEAALVTLLWVLRRAHQRRAASFAR